MPENRFKSSLDTTSQVLKGLTLTAIPAIQSAITLAGKEMAREIVNNPPKNAIKTQFALSNSIPGMLTMFYSALDILRTLFILGVWNDLSPKQRACIIGLVGFTLLNALYIVTHVNAEKNIQAQGIFTTLFVGTINLANGMACYLARNKTAAQYSEINSEDQAPNMIRHQP